MLGGSACPDSIVLAQRVAPLPASQAISHTSIWHNVSLQESRASAT